MKISVIVPNFNHREFLIKRLDSIFNQSYQNFEVILLDDCSNDGGWSLLKEFEHHPKVSYCIRNELNLGSPFLQWKKGIELAKNNWIWIAESDDYSDLNFLQNIYDFNKLNELDIVYCQSLDVNSDEHILSDRIVWTNDFIPNIWENSWVLNGFDFKKKFLQYKNVIPNASACVFKKSLVIQNNWDKVTKLNLCGDWLFWFLIIKNNNRVGFLCQRNNYFRFHNNVTRVYRDNYKKRNRVYEEFYLLETVKKEGYISNNRFIILQKQWFALFNFMDILTSSEIFLVNIYKNKSAFILNYLKFRFFD